MFLKNSKIYRKTPLLEYLFNKFAGFEAWHRECNWQPRRQEVSFTYVDRTILQGLAVRKNIEIVLFFCHTNFIWSNTVTTSQIGCSPQEKNERPAVAKLRFCDGIKQLSGCLTGELFPFWQKGKTGLRPTKKKISNGKSDLFQ